MTNEKIYYSDIMDLGFSEEVQYDTVYESEHGYCYSIITKKLTKKIYLDWQKDTKICKIVRLSDPKTGSIATQLPVNNLNQLKEIINFFSDKKENNPKI